MHDFAIAHVERIASNAGTPNDAEDNLHEPV
jgi:hypothetical protein